MTRVAVCQLAPVPGDPGARARSVAAIETALADGAEVIVLPELVVPGYTWDEGLLRAGAEPADGETVAAWRDAIRGTGALVAGGIVERDGEQISNTALLVDESGIVLHYRKLHLFAGERGVLAPGDLGLPVADTAHGRIGLCICYDLRFVEVLRGLALQGAELVCVPTAWTPGFDAEHWDAEGFCPQARNALMQANLDGVAIACASQAGQPGDHLLLGSSVIGDARGRCLAGPIGGDESGIAVADVAPAGAEDRGGGILPLADRRTDVYGLELGGVRL